MYYTLKFFLGPQDKSAWGPLGHRFGVHIKRQRMNRKRSKERQPAEQSQFCNKNQPPPYLTSMKMKELDLYTFIILTVFTFMVII